MTTTTGKIHCVNCDEWHAVIDGRTPDCPYARAREREDRLIAAAPAMLDTLKELVAEWDADGVFGDRAGEPASVHLARTILATLGG